MKSWQSSSSACKQANGLWLVLRNLSHSCIREAKVFNYQMCLTYFVTKITWVAKIYELIMLVHHLHLRVGVLLMYGHVVYLDGI